MSENLLSVAEQILENDEDIIVPIKKVWLKIRDEHHLEVPPLEQFTTMMRKDERFEFMPEHEDSDIYEGWAQEEIEEDEREMEKLGFFRGARVKLKRIEMTPEKLADILRRKVDNMMDALTKAWETRPEGDTETEDQLLQILASAQKLQREVKEKLTPEKMRATKERLEKEAKSKSA